MKYVMLRVSLGEIDKLVPVIFPNFMVHSDVSEAIQNVLKTQHSMEVIGVHSAGDVTIYECECSGSSETLKTKSDDGDTNAIMSYDHVHGLVL